MNLKQINSLLNMNRYLIHQDIDGWVDEEYAAKITAKQYALQYLEELEDCVFLSSSDALNLSNKIQELKKQIREDR